MNLLTNIRMSSTQPQAPTSNQWRRIIGTWIGKKKKKSYNKNIFELWKWVNIYYYYLLLNTLRIIHVINTVKQQRSTRVVCMYTAAFTASFLAHFASLAFDPIRNVLVSVTKTSRSKFLTSHFYYLWKLSPLACKGAPIDWLPIVISRQSFLMIGSVAS